LAVQKDRISKNIQYRGNFDIIKKKFQAIGLEVRLVPVDPKNPNGGQLIAITPNRVRGSNVEMLIDPMMRTKGLIWDQQNNEILLSADAAKNLIVTRTTYEYPFRKRGALNLTVITFKDNVNRSDTAIRLDSPYYIYKYRGEKYHMERGENRRGLSTLDSNVMTLKEYRKRKEKGSFKELLEDYLK